MGRIKLTRDQTITISILVVALCLFVYYVYASYADAKLVSIVKDELNELHLQTDGPIVYQQIEANRDCKWAELSVVYSSNRSPKDICASVLSSLQLRNWQPYHVQEKIEFCEGRPVTLTTELNALNPSKTVNLTLQAFPKAAAHTTTFMDVWPGVETDVKQEAIKHGESFYDVRLRYQTPDDRETYSCGEAYDCDCFDHTYSEDTSSELYKLKKP